MRSNTLTRVSNNPGAVHDPVRPLFPPHNNLRNLCNPCLRGDGVCG